MIAKVVANGSDEETLSKAIESGFLAVEAERAYKSILKENKALKAEIERLKNELKIADEIMNRDREIWIDALSALINA